MKKQKRSRGEDSRQMVLDFIESYSDENMRPPTVREIQDHCGFKSPRAVSYILEKLEEAKLIIREARSRGVFLAKARQGVKAPIVQIPLFEGIPAGLPDRFEGAAAPETLRFIPATLGIKNPKRAFAIKVRGNSMVGAGILSGDTVVLEQREAQHGDIVAALLDGETTLKRLVKKRGGFYLKAENPSFPDLEPVEQLAVQGVVISVLRRVGEAN